MANFGIIYAYSDLNSVHRSRKQVEIMKNRLNRLQFEEQRARSRIEVARRKADMLESTRNYKIEEQRRKQKWRQM